MASLDTLLNKIGLNKQALEIQVDDEVFKVISSKLSPNWECLATRIGVADDIVHDIKVAEASNFPLALLTRWKELYGSEATYCKLIKGLDEIGRRDLTDKVLYFKYKGQSSAKRSAPFIETRRFMTIFILLLVLVAVILGISILLTVSGNVFFTVFNDTLCRDDFRVVDYTSIPHLYLDNNTCCDSRDVLYKQRVLPHDQSASHCETVYSNLPNIQMNIFIGRDKDIAEIMRKVQSTHIVNVNGPPGFGKSSVVIHTGYKLLKNGTSVRYVDIEQELPRIFIESAHDHDSHKSSTYHRKTFSKNTTAILETI